jgi:hypothetical protein
VATPTEKDGVSDGLHWFPRIQASGTGLALMSGFGPTLHIEIPYAVRLLAFSVGGVMLVWPFIDFIAEKIRSKRKTLISGVMASVVLIAAGLATHLWITQSSSHQEIASVAPVLPPAQDKPFSETYTFTYPDARKLGEEVFKIRGLLPPTLTLQYVYDPNAPNVAWGLYEGIGFAGVQVNRPTQNIPVTPQETGISLRVADPNKKPNSAKAFAGAIKNALGVEAKYTPMRGLKNDQFVIFVGSNPNDH